MSGLYGTSPWGRQGIYAMDDADRQSVEEAIPAGYSITVAAERSPGSWTVRLNRDGREVDRVKPAHDIGTAARTLLARLEAVRG